MMKKDCKCADLSIKSLYLPFFPSTLNRDVHIFSSQYNNKRAINSKKYCIYSILKRFIFNKTPEHFFHSQCYKLKTGNKVRDTKLLFILQRFGHVSDA